MSLSSNPSATKRTCTLALQMLQMHTEDRVYPMHRARHRALLCRVTFLLNRPQWMPATGSYRISGLKWESNREPRTDPGSSGRGLGIILCWTCPAFGYMYMTPMDECHIVQPPTLGLEPTLATVLTLFGPHPPIIGYNIVLDMPCFR